MFGKNPVRKATTGSGSILDVVEIFPTIQGEGPYAGRPAHFIRLFGCNLRCHFCDTDFESRMEPMSVDRIVEQIRTNEKIGPFNADLIVITGGEPMRQQLGPLVGRLLTEQFTVQIETAGILFPASLRDWIGHPALTLVCSPKTAEIDPEVAAICKDYKYIVRDQGAVDPEDGLPMSSTQIPGKICRIYRPEAGLARIYLQPCEEYHPDGTPDDEGTRANVEAAAFASMQFNYTLSLQLHKLIGLP